MSVSSTWGNMFNSAIMREYVGYNTTYNTVTQTIALDANANDIQSNGTGLAIVNGVPKIIPACAAQDLSAENFGNATGVIVANTYDQFFMITAKVDGHLQVWVAGTPVLTATGTATMDAIPAYDPTTYIPVAFMKVAANAAITIGTTALTGLVTFYPIIGPIYPAAINIDRN